jgi:hypothetical protein
MGWDAAPKPRGLKQQDITPQSLPPVGEPTPQFHFLNERAVTQMVPLEVLVFSMELYKNSISLYKVKCINLDSI